MGRNVRVGSDDDWERERRLDIGFEQEPRVRPHRRRFEIGGRTRAAIVGVPTTPSTDGES